MYSNPYDPKQQYQQPSQNVQNMMVPGGNMPQPIYSQSFQPQPSSLHPQMQAPLLQQPYGQVPLAVHMFQPRMLGLDKLMSIKGVYVRQKFRTFQALTGCQQTQRHFIYALGDDGKCKKGSKMFKCKENSSFWMRQCCAPACRSFDSDMNHKDYYDPSFNEMPFLKFERAFRCSFFCFNRPEMVISWVEQGQRTVLGKIVNPFLCCDLRLQVYDAQDNLIYSINGDCCQAGILCQGPCFQEVEFKIHDSHGQQVASLNRVKANFVQNLVDVVANFTVSFPLEANGPERALLVASAIMLDYIYFARAKKGAISDGMDIASALA